MREYVDGLVRGGGSAPGCRLPLLLMLAHPAAAKGAAAEARPPGPPPPPAVRVAALRALGRLMALSDALAASGPGAAAVSAALECPATQGSRPAEGDNGAPGASAHAGPWPCARARGEWDNAAGGVALAGARVAAALARANPTLHAPLLAGLEALVARLLAACEAGGPGALAAGACEAGGPGRQGGEGEGEGEEEGGAAGVRALALQVVAEYAAVGGGRG